MAGGKGGGREIAIIRDKNNQRTGYIKIKIKASKREIDISVCLSGAALLPYPLRQQTASSS